MDLGLASTDLLYFAAGYLDAPGAMFTASHNPAQYNGIKFCRSGARPVGESTGLSDIKALAGIVLEDAPNELGRVSERNLLDEFADHVRSFLTDPGSLRPLKVVADTANGMGGLIVPAVFGPLPFELEILYPELDGTFPNHPADPIQPRTRPPCAPGSSRRAPTSVSPSTATPIGCSSSTSWATGSRAPRPPRWWPRWSSTASPAPRSSTT